jgi:hypothetical protein
VPCKILSCLSEVTLLASKSFLRILLLNSNKNLPSEHPTYALRVLHRSYYYLSHNIFQDSTSRISLSDL